MTLDALNARIEALPEVEFKDGVMIAPRTIYRYLRDERLGILGVAAGQEPTEEQVGIVAQQLGLDEL